VLTAPCLPCFAAHHISPSEVVCCLHAWPCNPCDCPWSPQAAGVCP
jgi:hypothetical protein